MQQLESVMLLSQELIIQARKQLLRNFKTRDQTILEEIQGMEDGKHLCPFCAYESKKNRTSGIVRNGFFKCMACGAKGRVR